MTTRGWESFLAAWDNDDIDALGAAYDALRAECEALRKDADRWRWAKHRFRIFGSDMGGENTWACNGDFGRIRGATISEAIDAARAAEKGEENE